MQNRASPAVDLQDIEAGLGGAPGRLFEKIEQFVQRLAGELVRQRIGRHLDHCRVHVPKAGVGDQRIITVIDLVPGPVIEHFAAAVGELEARRDTLLVQELGHPAERAHLLFLPDADRALDHAGLARDRRRLEEDEGGAAAGEAAEMGQVPVADHAGNRHIGRHRPDDDTIGQRQAADLERREQKWILGHGLPCEKARTAYRRAYHNCLRCRHDRRAERRRGAESRVRGRVRGKGDRAQPIAGASRP